MNDTYYDTEGKRVKDFFLGFILSIVIGVFVYFVFGTILGQLLYYLGASKIYSSGFFSSLLSTILPILLGGILGTVLAFKRGRRYIGIGIICAIVLPLLFFGACLIVISGLG